MSRGLSANEAEFRPDMVETFWVWMWWDEKGKLRVDSGPVCQMNY